MLKTAKNTSSPTNGHGDDLDAVDAGQGGESAQRGSDVTRLFAAAGGRSGAAASYPVEETVRSEIQRVRLDLLARETERLQQRLQQILEERRQDRQVIDELRQQIEQVTQKGLLMAAHAKPDGADGGAGADLDREIKPLLKTLLQLMERAKQVPTTQGAAPGGGNPAPQAPAQAERTETAAAKGPSDSATPSKPAPQGTAAQPAPQEAAARPALQEAPSTPDAWGQIDFARDSNQSVATAPAERPQDTGSAHGGPAPEPEEDATAADLSRLDAAADSPAAPAAEGTARATAHLGFTSLDDDDDEEGLQRGDPGFVEVARLLRQPDPRTEARARRTEGLRARDLRHDAGTAKAPPAKPVQHAAPAAPAAKAAPTEAPPANAAPARAAPARSEARDESLTARKVEAPAKPPRAEKSEPADALLLGTADTPRVDAPAITTASGKAQPAADPAPAPSEATPAPTGRGSFLRARRTAPQPIKAHGLKGREDAVARRLAAVVDRATAASEASALDAKTAAEAQSPAPASPAPSRPLAPSAPPPAAVSRPAENRKPEVSPAAKTDSAQANLARPAERSAIETASAVDRPVPAEAVKRPASPPPLAPDGTAGEDAAPKAGRLGLTRDANPIRAALPKCLTEPWDEEDPKEGFRLGGAGGTRGGLRWPFRKGRGGKAAEASGGAAAPAPRKADDEPEGRDE